jgi:hypothetical protein
MNLDTVVATKIMDWKWFRGKSCEWLDNHPFGKESLVAFCYRQNASFILSPERYKDLDLFSGLGCIEECDGTGMTVMSPEFKGMPGVCKDWGKPPRYSSNMTHTWEVVKKMQDKNYGLVFNDAHGVYRARFFQYFDLGWDMREWVKWPDKELTAWTTSAEKCICVAALNMIGVDANIVKRLEGDPACEC